MHQILASSTLGVGLGDSTHYHDSAMLYSMVIIKLATIMIKFKVQLEVQLVDCKVCTYVVSSCVSMAESSASASNWIAFLPLEGSTSAVCSFVGFQQVMGCFLRLTRCLDAVFFWLLICNSELRTSHEPYMLITSYFFCVKPFHISLNLFHKWQQWGGHYCDSIHYHE